MGVDLSCVEPVFVFVTVTGVTLKFSPRSLRSVVDVRAARTLTTPVGTTVLEMVGMRVLGIAGMTILTSR